MSQSTVNDLKNGVTIMQKFSYESDFCITFDVCENKELFCRLTVHGNVYYYYQHYYRPLLCLSFYHINAIYK